MTVAIALLPVIVAFICGLVAPFLPQDQVWPHVVHVIMLSAPGWLMLFWPAWIVLWAWRSAQWRLGAALLVISLVLAPRPQRWSSDATGWRVLSANVDAYSPDEDDAGLAAALASHNPDVLFLHEHRISEVPGMVRVADNLDVEVERESHRAFAFCRDGLACKARVTEEFGSATMTMPLTILRLDGLCMLGVHAPPPVPYDTTGLGPYIDRVRAPIASGRLMRGLAPCEQHDPVLVVGDLNAVPNSRAHMDLLATGLSDVLAGQGPWAATWPNGGGWPDLPVFQLDHVLAGALTVSRVDSFDVPGADHKALLVRVSP